MLEVYGTRGCGKCEVVKTKLKNDEKKFTYTLLGNLGNKEKESIMQKAEENNVISLPIVFKDGEIIKGGIF